MPVTQLIYASKPFGYDEGILRQILGTARQNNQKAQITGALICREDIFLQLLEGPTTEVKATFERIKHDDRHIEVRELVNNEVGTRMFPDWAMRHDPVQSWMWSQEDIHNGVIETTDKATVVSFFERLAQSGHDTSKTPGVPGQSCPFTPTSN
ncbi:MAG: BLUF domain-containing protein [Pseudomonadota bacterium]